MQQAQAIYWYLFWEHSIDFLNDLVTEAYRKGDWKQVEFYCKVIALRQMKIDKDKFWEKEVMGEC